VTESRPTISAERDWSGFLAEAGFEAAAPLAQAMFLADAMARLGLSREALAARIGVSSKGMAKWMADRESRDFRAMPRIAWKFIVEIVAAECLFP
jgi:hypothetical protein